MELKSLINLYTTKLKATQSLTENIRQSVVDTLSDVHDISRKIGGIIANDATIRAFKDLLRLFDTLDKGLISKEAAVKDLESAIQRALDSSEIEKIRIEALIEGAREVESVSEYVRTTIRARILSKGMQDLCSTF